MLGSTNLFAGVGLLSAKVEVDSPMLKGFLHLQNYQKMDLIKRNSSNFVSLSLNGLNKLHSQNRFITCAKLLGLSLCFGL